MTATLQDRIAEKLNEIEMGRLADIFIVFKDIDGNYIGLTTKHGNHIQVRDVGPETVLQLLLTHDGKQTHT